MIRIHRPPAPPFFSSDAYAAMQEDLQRAMTGVKTRAGWNDAASRVAQQLVRIVRPELIQAFKQKCAYCEQRIASPDESTIDRFRPKGGARGLEKEFHPRHYWWLALEWENLLLTCPACNRYKQNYFPVEEEIAQEGAKGEALLKEGPLFIDPCHDDPTKHVFFEEDGEMTPLSKRGKVTIDVLNLNRTALIEGRRSAWDRITLLLSIAMGDGFGGEAEDAARQIREMLGESSDAPYLGFLRCRMEVLAADDPQVEALLEERLEAQTRGIHIEQVRMAATGPRIEPVDINLNRLSIERVELRNFKVIEDLTIELETKSSEAKWLVFLGENGVGKSSVLQAIVLSLVGDEYREMLGIRPRDVLRYYQEDGKLQYCDSGYVRIYAAGYGQPVELTFFRDADKFESNLPEPGTYVLGYGSTRLFSGKGLREEDSPGMVRVRNLFEPVYALHDAAKWLYELAENDAVAFEGVCETLRGLLLLPEDAEIIPDRELKGRMLFQVNGELSDLSHLSDGYRTVLAFATDIMYILLREGGRVEAAEGIVVVDEIGTNLHPRWKMQVVERFRKAFPYVQFFVTTHEPLVLRGLDRGEVVIMKRDEHNRIVAWADLPAPRDFRVDQLLASEFFGLSSTVDPEVEREFNEYYDLLAREAELDKNEKARLKLLHDELHQRRHLGTTLREELMYEVIDKLVARQFHSPRPVSRKALKQETVDKVLEAWQRAGLTANDSEEL